MFNSFKFNNIKYSLVKVKDIINIYTIPKCQRNSLLDRINYLDKTMFFKFMPITPIYFVIFKNNKYIIDGLHRLEVYKQNKIYLEEKIPIVEILANIEDDIYNYFKLINDTMSVHDIYKDPNNKNLDIYGNEIEDIEMEDIEQRKEIIISTYSYFLEQYPNTFKFNGKRRPYLDNNKFIDDLNIIYDNLKTNNINHNINIKSSNDFINLLLELNIKYQNQNIEWFPSKGKVQNKNLIKIIQQNNCLYFGMLPNEWYNHILNIPEYNSEDKISQSLRQQVWNKYAKNKLEIKCICCNLNIINAFTFECGHIIASSKGGKCNIKNLVPICSLCNKSMSNMNMKEFMIKHEYNIPKLLKLN
jgi:hypothetical protein